MTEPATYPLTSLNALASTIRTDPLTARWFEFLLTRPTVREKFAADPAWAKVYDDLHQAARATAVLLHLLLALFLWGGWTLNPYLLGGALLFWWPYTKIRNRKNEVLSRLGLTLIAPDFPPERLAQTTLYQLGEFYSQRHDVPSLVDTIFFFDRTARWLYLAVLLIILFILPLDPHRQVACVLAVWVFLHCGTRIDFIYKRWR